MEINGEIQEKGPNLKNGFPDSGPDSNSKEAASEENSELEQEMMWSKKKELSLIFPYLIKVLKACWLTFLFPIQAKTFHHVYSGKDLIAQVQTGTGKTFSFAIPLVEKLGELQDRKRGVPLRYWFLHPQGSWQVK